MTQNKIKLPPRKWYSLQQAAEKLTRDCKEPVTVDDLLHYAINNILELCIHINFSNYFGLRIPLAEQDSIKYLINGEYVEYLPNLSSSLKIIYRYSDNNIGEYLTNPEKFDSSSYFNKYKEKEIKIEDMIINPVMATIKSRYYEMKLSPDTFEGISFDGLVAIKIDEMGESLTPYDTSLFVKISSTYQFLDNKTQMLENSSSQFNLPRNSHKGEYALYFKHKILHEDILDFESVQIIERFKIPFEALLVTDDELEQLKKGGLEIENQNRKNEFISMPSPKTQNTQARIIRDLLQIHYGFTTAQEVRKALDDPASEISVDFDMKGLTKPNGKTVYNYLNRIED